MTVNSANKIMDQVEIFFNEKNFKQTVIIKIDLQSIF